MNKQTFCNLEQNDIEQKIKNYLREQKPQSRYTSFDYCYNYFSKKESKDLINDIEKSCLVLGFYLASWGMFKGSSFLLNKSAKHLENTIIYISKLDSSYWDIDVNNYDKNIHKIKIVYDGIKEKIQEGEIKKHFDLTLVTKILLGVFGFIPAFDTNFCKTFKELSNCGFSKVNETSLSVISDFYKSNQEIIDKLYLTTFTLNFKTGEKTSIHYPKAKIIDMYGFQRYIDSKNNS